MVDVPQVLMYISPILTITDASIVGTVMFFLVIPFTQKSPTMDMKRIATFVTFKKEAVDTVLLNGLRIEAILNIQKKLI